MDWVLFWHCHQFFPSHFSLCSSHRWAVLWMWQQKMEGKFFKDEDPVSSALKLYSAPSLGQPADALLLFLLFSHSDMSNSLRPHGLLHGGLPCSSLHPGACANSCPLSQWCHPTISSSVVHFSSCLHSFPASGSFLMSWLFTSGGQSIGASASASVLPMNTQDWFPLGLTGLISLQSKGLSRVFSNTTVQKHQFFGAQSSLCPTLTSIHDYWINHSFD